jgi:hypothetical protein
MDRKNHDTLVELVLVDGERDISVTEGGDVTSARIPRDRRGSRRQLRERGQGGGSEMNRRSTASQLDALRPRPPPIRPPQGGTMDNEQALELLDALVEAAIDTVQTGIWARAFLQEGGEPAWDATKSVSRSAKTLAALAAKAAELENQFDEIAP